MPWTVDDVNRHYKGLTGKQKRQWVHVANGSLERGDEDGVAIRKANGAVNNSKVESVLYNLANQYVNAVRLQEAAKIFDGVVLSEADPKPRVETDINGEPVIPSTDQFQNYFDTMTAANIEMALAATRKRWADAKKDSSNPEVQSMSNELKAGQEILQKKGNDNLNSLNSVAVDIDARQAQIRSVIQHVAKCLMMDLISQQ